MRTSLHSHYDHEHWSSIWHRHTSRQHQHHPLLLLLLLLLLLPCPAVVAAASACVCVHARLASMFLTNRSTCLLL
jgi:hypothetical protein